ncbi:MULTISPECIES: hypothetical protein [unclassified Dolichospermum]|jgi:hypothetical protein|uniref:hypothetical protein n=1 Tax=unclassified Dolichospermum TaxID=2622029 RepID=UPI001446DA5F|nr:MULTISPECIES: hypothetical protein [unclassified Dolichospermum]MTJ19587.1 hypothetical protein [Dolichospermum sp. UHCC 0299]MTJ37366.1 hypothetical protein [Dolichospermum sp. UHCC 0406]
MDINTEKSDVYGRLDITLPEAVYEAGKVSIVTILLRNPFNEPVEILEIQGPRSSHLSEVVKDFRATSRNQSSNSNSRQVKRKPGWIKSLFQNFNDFLMTPVDINAINVGGLAIEFPKSKSVLNIDAKPNSETEIDTDLSNYDTVNISVDEGAKVKFSQQTEVLQPAEKKSMTIEPHCEAVAYFEISTGGWLFFTPTRRSLSTLVRYRVNNREKTQVITSEFDVRPPLLSMVVGAVIGSVLGTLAKVLNTVKTLEGQTLIVSLGAAVVMSLIATIALSRKTGTQGFITVEDFFGGFVVGSLIGYGGSAYFERAIIPTTPNSPTS